ncbi:hypothetical protein Tco_1225926 [Tanacetum coccineum]
MLKSFSREDLEDFYKLVKAKYKSTRPVEDLDLVLWSDLKTMFETTCRSKKFMEVATKGRIVGIKSLLNAVSITAALIDVNAAQSKLVLLENFNENYSKCLRLLYKVNATEGVNAANEEVSTAELVSTAYVILLPNIPCLKKCRIVRQLLVDHAISYALTATANVSAVYIQQFWKTVRQVPNHNETNQFMVNNEEITYTVNMFRTTLKLPVKTPEQPFIPPANFSYIKPFLRILVCQGSLKKVSAFFTKNLAQPCKKEKLQKQWNQLWKSTCVIPKRSEVARLKIDDNAHFELKGQFLKELRDHTFSGSDNQDANEHIEKVIEIVDLFHIPEITQDHIMLRAFHMSLTGAASRWLRNEPSGSIITWETRPPMLERGIYIPWASRFRRYLYRKREKRKWLNKAIDEGPYEFRIFTPSKIEALRMQKEEDLRGDDLKHYEAEIEAMNLILISIPNDIYNYVDACTTAKAMWQRVERLMRGTVQNKVNKETRFNNKFDQFIAESGEALMEMFVKAMMGLSLEVGWIRRIQVLDMAYWGFLGVGTTLDIFQNIILIPYFEYGVLSLFGYGVLSLFLYGLCEKGHYARNCPKPRVRDSKYFMEQMLLAKHDEAGVILTNEQNDFLFDDASRMEEIEELSANICLMARIQPENFDSDEGPSYDSAFLNAVQTPSTSYVNPLFAKDAHEQKYPNQPKIINNIIGDDQIDSNIIFDEPNRDVNCGSVEYDNNVQESYALEQLARITYKEAVNQQNLLKKFNNKTQR